MTALDDLTGLAATLSNPHIEGWKERGGKVVGYYCTYVPVEIIHAAGMLPYRMRATGSASSDLGDVYTYRTMCTFCRHSLDQAMRGEFGFLDGLVAFYSCDHVRRLYDVWKHGKVDFPRSPFYLHFMSIPMKSDEETVEWLTSVFGRFKRSLEDHFQVTITDDAIRDSIRAYNERRTLLGRLYELRKGETPPLTGTEMLGIMIAATAMPVEEFNQKLKDLLEELKGREGLSGYRARLLVGGGELEDPDYIKTIEDLGGLVVTDFLCFGVRDFWSPVEEDGDPLRALAKRYLERPSCPRMVDHPRRQQFLTDLARDFKVDGIIVQRMKYCDTWGGESAMMEWDLKKEGVATPYMVLEREYMMGAVGQMRTRVQAFLETIGR